MERRTICEFYSCLILSDTPGLWSLTFSLLLCFVCSNNDSSVNIAYLDSKTGDWVSISGKAIINSDRSKVKKHFSAGLKAWFDDKKDGTHTGDENDPRVALIDVHPDVSVPY